MEVQQDTNLYLFAFITVHTVTKNYRSVPKYLGFMTLSWEDLVFSKSQNYLNEMKVFLSRGE